MMKIQFARYLVTKPFPLIPHTCICGLAACVPFNLCPANRGQDWGRIGEHETCLAPYQGSDWETIDSMLKLANFRPGDRILDLGAGDGRILIRAMQLGAGKAVGWELRKEVCDLAEAHLNTVLTSSQRSKVCIHHGDASQCDLQNTDIVVLFLLPFGLAAVQKSLMLQMDSFNNIDKKRLKFVSAGWPIPHWNIAEQATTPGGTRLFLHTTNQSD